MRTALPARQIPPLLAGLLRAGTDHPRYPNPVFDIQDIVAAEVAHTPRHTKEQLGRAAIALHVSRGSRVGPVTLKCCSAIATLPTQSWKGRLTYPFSVLFKEL
jgi:hypothetical protein